MTKKDRGDGRNIRGQWTKCGNPNGRPKKIPDLDMADMYNFSQSTMEINVGGKKQLMTRQEILLMRTYETAMKGNQATQKYLIEKFEEIELSRAFLLLRYEQFTRRREEDPESISDDEFDLMVDAFNSLKGRNSGLRMRDPQPKKRK